MATGGENPSGSELFAEARHYTRQLEAEMREAGLSGNDIEKLMGEVENNNDLAQGGVYFDSGNGGPDMQRDNTVCTNGRDDNDNREGYFDTDSGNLNSGNHDSGKDRKSVG